MAPYSKRHSGREEAFKKVDFVKLGNFIVFIKIYEDNIDLQKYSNFNMQLNVLGIVEFDFKIHF